MVLEVVLVLVSPPLVLVVVVWVLVLVSPPNLVVIVLVVVLVWLVVAGPLGPPDLLPTLVVVVLVLVAGEGADCLPLKVETLLFCFKACLRLFLFLPLEFGFNDDWHCIWVR